MIIALEPVNSTLPLEQFPSLHFQAAKKHQFLPRIGCPPVQMKRKTLSNKIDLQDSCWEDTGATVNFRYRGTHSPTVKYVSSQN